MMLYSKLRPFLYGELGVERILGSARAILQIMIYKSYKN